MRLAWDPRAHPKVMVRNDGGEIIAMGQGGALDLLTASAGLTVELSDGLRSVKRWVRVEPR